VSTRPANPSGAVTAWPVGSDERGREKVERTVLDVVDGLVAELGGAGRRGAALDDALDRDLGLGSLERVELLLRLEQAFGIRLSDAVMAEAGTPGELVTALLAAQPAAPEPAPAPAARLAPGRAAPGSVRTLVEALHWHVDADPERPHVFLRQEDGPERTIRYGDLWHRAAAVAIGLQARGLEAGDRVALMLRTEEAFFAAFFGALLAGGIAVPIYPPFRRDRLEEYAHRQAGILRNAEARWLLTFPEARPVASLLRARAPSLRSLATVDEMAKEAVPTPASRRRASDPALIQYTSGSTGDPKGVLLTHANVLANIRAIGEAIAIGPEDVGVSWLPLYHDMGLIGSWLAALYFGIPIAILSPVAFLARPARWLRTLAAHRGTLSPAPNFAFDLCVRKIADDELQGLDVSSWRLAFNGSEPVSPETIERFSRRFGPYGFRAEAMCPVYGLAEAAVALTVPSPGRSPRVDRIRREPFERAGQALPTPAGDPSPLRFVACGHPLPGHEVRIVDPAGRPVEDRVEGRIEFRGPSVTGGYFRNPEATRAAVHEGWMDSGDLGYWADGDLFVTGRQKDLIIKAGRNLYPQEVEELAGAVPGIRKGCVVAFGVADPAIGTERLVVVAESRETEADTRERLRAAVVDRLATALGLPPDTVVIAAPGTVPKTSSGKVRRRAAREAYRRGDLGRGRPSAARQWVRLRAADVGLRLARLAGTVAHLAFAGYVAVWLLFTLPVLWLGVAIAPGPRAAARLVRAWCRLALVLGRCRLRVEGLEHLPATGAAVLAANHASYLDAVVLLAAIPADFRFVAKRELTTYPVIGTVIRKVGHLMVERGDPARSAAGAEHVSRALAEGRLLLVFPEGTFRRDAGLLPFRLGAFKAAVERQRPVIPIAIRGTRDVLPADTSMPRPGPVAVIIGAPIAPEGTGWPAMVGLRDRVRAETARLTRESPVDLRPV
jgi:1-acyl-sn-glycerol-3-phosphate acyltransferase